MRYCATVERTTELQALLEKFAERGGVRAELHIADGATDLVDERAATVLDMARELLRNVEHHADATTVWLTLKPDTGGLWMNTVVYDETGWPTCVVPPGAYSQPTGSRSTTLVVSTETSWTTVFGCGSLTGSDPADPTTTPTWVGPVLDGNRTVPDTVQLLPGDRSAPPRNRHVSTCVS